jgi:hypothetical protein
MIEVVRTSVPTPDEAQFYEDLILGSDNSGSSGTRTRFATRK